MTPNHVREKRLTKYIGDSMARVALIGDNSVEYVNTLLDIWNNGDCAVFIDWRIPFPTAYEMMIEANVSKCYIERRIFSKINTEYYLTLQFEVYDNNTVTAKELPVDIYEKFHENYSLNEAVIIYSSGTTGKSKGVILSHYAINTNADAIMEYMKLGNNDCIYMVKTISHLSSITGELLTALKSRIRIIIGPVVVPPRIILNNVQKFSVTDMCLNPTILRLIVDERKRKEYDIPSLYNIYVHGAKTDTKLFQNAKTVFSKINIYFEYGLTEAGPRVTSQKVNDSHNESVGLPIFGVQITIIGDNGLPSKTGVKGIIHVKTPSLYNGYVKGEEKHKSLYNDWLNTGDIGYIDNVGELHVVDRIDDVINIGAHKVYPSDVEKLILGNNNISACVVSKCTYNGAEMIGCLYVSDNDCALNIMRQLKAELLPYEIPKRYVRVSAIPHNVRGKVNRSEVGKILSVSVDERT
jgi:long-chain acyl-CoA synthetase